MSADPHSAPLPTVINLVSKRRLLVLDVGKLLWLPHDYEPYYLAMKNCNVAIGHKSGHISFIEFD